MSHLVPHILHFQGKLDTHRLHLSPSETQWPPDLLAYKLYRPRIVFHRTQRVIRFPFESLWRVLPYSYLFGAPLLRPCKIAAWYLSRWPLPSSVLQSQRGLSSGVASSVHRSGFAVPSGAIALNHFLASVRILCLSSVLKRETSSWIMSSHAGRWVRKIVSITLIW